MNSSQRRIFAFSSVVPLLGLTGLCYAATLMQPGEKSPLVPVSLHEKVTAQDLIVSGPSFPGKAAFKLRKGTAPLQAADHQTTFPSPKNMAVLALFTGGAILAVTLMVRGLLLYGHFQAGGKHSRLTHEPARLNLAQLGGRLTLLREVHRTVGSHQQQLASCLQLLTLQNEKIILLQNQNRRLRTLAKASSERHVSY